LTYIYFKHIVHDIRTIYADKANTEAWHGMCIA